MGPGPRSRLAASPIPRHLPGTALHTLQSFPLVDRRTASPRPLPSRCSVRLRIAPSPLARVAAHLQPQGFALPTSPLPPRMLPPTPARCSPGLRSPSGSSPNSLFLSHVSIVSSVCLAGATEIDLRSGHRDEVFRLDLPWALTSHARADDAALRRSSRGIQWRSSCRLTCRHLIGSRRSERVGGVSLGHPSGERPGAYRRSGYETIRFRRQTRRGRIADPPGVLDVKDRPIGRSFRCGDRTLGAAPI